MSSKSHLLINLAAIGWVPSVPFAPYPCSSRDLIRAACATVEERPFQGRVTKEEDGLQPSWSPWGLHPGLTAAQKRPFVYRKNNPTKKRPDLNDRASNLHLRK